jgi:hypothetical protein
VRDGYTTSRIQVTAGTPVRLLFDRQEAGGCAARVIFPDFGTAADLPAFGRASVELTPARRVPLSLRHGQDPRRPGRHLRTRTCSGYSRKRREFAGLLPRDLAVAWRGAIIDAGALTKPGEGYGTRVPLY